MNEAKSVEHWAYDEAGDLHLVTEAQRDSILAGERVTVPIVGDDYERELVGIWRHTPHAQGIRETPWIDPDETLEP